LGAIIPLPWLLARAGQRILNYFSWIEEIKSKCPLSRKALLFDVRRLKFQNLSLLCKVMILWATLDRLERKSISKMCSG
jgi:hypothetical protein